MGRPRRLTDEERAASNAARQRRWRERHLGFARLKEKNWRKGRLKVMAEQLGFAVEQNLTKSQNEPNALPALPHYGEVHYGPIEGYDVMEQKGGQADERRKEHTRNDRDNERGGVRIPLDPTGIIPAGAGEVGSAAFSGGSTEEERAIEWLAAKRRERGRGVEVDLKL